MIYRNGKKIKAIFRNGKSISKIFRNGELVWQKDKPEAKRVKSIRVSLPLWGTPERIEWESIFRAVPKDISGYYLDVTIKGIGVRLLGAGGRYAGSIDGNTIELPSNLLVTTDELYSGLELSFAAKLPSVTREPTLKSSTSSYKSNAFYQFGDAPFVDGSTFKASVKTSAFGFHKMTWSVKADITGAFTEIAPAVTNKGSATSISIEYKDKDFRTMAQYGADTWMTCTPSFYVKLSPEGKISKPTLVSPACDLSYRMKIVSVKTY